VHSYSIWTPKINLLFRYIYKIICRPFIDGCEFFGHGELALGQGGETLRCDKALFDNSPILTLVCREVLSISNDS
jgi:hypothetical protein